MNIIRCSTSPRKSALCGYELCHRNKCPFQFFMVKNNDVQFFMVKYNDVQLLI